MIDWPKVEQLRAEIGSEDFDEVVNLFLNEIAEIMTRLEISPDVSTLEADLHLLKGTALNLGFGNLGVSCAEAERQLMTGTQASVDIPKLMRVYHVSIAEFTKQLGQDKAA